MADNNNQNGQDASQQIIDFIKSYKWRIVVSLHFNYSNLILTLGFWKTILVIVLCLIGIGVGYIKDRTQDFIIS